MLHALNSTDKPGSLAADPCGLAGLFQSVEARASNRLINNPGV